VRGDAIVQVAEGAGPTAAELASEGKLFLLQPDALGPMLGLVAGDGALDPKVQPARGCRQVILACNRGELDAVALGEVNQILVLARLARKPVSIPGDDGADATLLRPREHLLEVRTTLVVVRAEVVVNEDPLDLPAQPLAQAACGWLLPLDPERGAVPGAGDAAVDRRRDGLGHARSLAHPMCFLNTG